MIKKLRKKVVLLTMISLFALLTVVVTAMNIINYGDVVNTADEVLQYLTAGGEKKEDGRGGKGKGPGPDDGRGWPFTPTDGDIPMFDMPWRSPRRINDETAYESRFFFVVLDADGGLVVVDTGRIAAVDSEEAVDIAQEVYASDKTDGFYGVYRYMVKHEENGHCRLTFLDCSRSLYNFRFFRNVSIGMAFAALAVVLVVVHFFSGRIIRPIAESYEKQKRFITDAGHEIKTPLTIINANAELLECDFGENESIDDIKDQTKRLAALTEKLVYLSKMEEDGNKLPMEDFSLSDLLNEMTPAFAHLAQAKGKRFTAQVQPDVTLHGNAESVSQLVSLLLDNAVKYASPDGEIAVSLLKQVRHVCLTVANPTEEKMEKDDLPRVFDRFYRTDQSRNSETGGHGIGLSVAKAITEQHDGKIKADLSDGVFTVTVTLPA